ncbi:MAG: class D beta-lactamase [Chitinophagaceae bacterium]|nr:MAG: class D beta-lactamase [Chitinophagaceae bacterium]
MKILYWFLLVFVATGLFCSCSNNNVQIRNDWSKYFSGNGISGCFMLHDATRNVFQIYNITETQERHAPGQTFDIMNALAGLETGVIADTNMIIKDSAGNPDPDLTMAEAFRRSDESYFSVIARRIGKIKMDFWMDSVKYGNRAILPYDSEFWMNDTLRISPDEQMGLMENLFYGKLPFQSRTVRLVKDLLLREKNMNYSISYKTGFPERGQLRSGWITGWIEKNEKPYFFVLYMSSSDKNKDLKSLGINILHGILTGEGYFK